MLNDKMIKVELENYILYDKINAIASQYTTTTDFLISIAIQRLIDDIEFLRELRIGKQKANHYQDVQI